MADGQIDSNRDAGENGLFNVALAAGAIFLGVGAFKGAFKGGAKQVAKEVSQNATHVAEKEVAQAVEKVGKEAAGAVKSGASAAPINKEDMFKMNDLADKVGYKGFAEAGSVKEAKDIAAMIYNDAGGNMKTAEKIIKHKAGNAQPTENLKDFVKKRQNMTRGEIRDERFVEAKPIRDQQYLDNLNRNEEEMLKAAREGRL